MRALAYSGGKDSLACLHLMRESLDCAIYVNTGYAYPETLALVEYARQFVPVHVVNSVRGDALPSDIVPSDWTEVGQLCGEKKAVTVIGYHECCYASIAAPLMEAAHRLGVTEIVNGQRNEENHKSTSRDGDMVQGIKRLHPIESWTEREVLDYLATKMTVPDHFRTVKHSSLDCYDCTAYRKDSRCRVEWTRVNHPAFHAAYTARRDRLNAAITEAMNDG